MSGVQAVYRSDTGRTTSWPLEECLRNIQNGEYAKRFISEYKVGAPSMTARRRQNAEHQIEIVGAKLREMMPWIKANRLVDQEKN